ncbi:MAG: hypothetical protein N3G22_05035, partial [Candidatus Micrarchaeota archaeon]|nr:hypothetical protein [Candidatus Micrarchaeota archaeon]
MRLFFALSSALFLALFVFFTGCAQQPPAPPTPSIVCNPPYIQVGKDCCLDHNNNSICDKDEPAAQTLPAASNGSQAVPPAPPLPPEEPSQNATPPPPAPPE